MMRSGWCCTLLLGAIAILGRVLLFPILPHPTPRVHDEFSYLLGANTFAAGRLSTDSHPHSEFFETFHVLSHPRYMSKYPPGQAAVLAVGIVLGHPHNGVILSFGLFVITIVWMLRSIVPVKWAVFGGAWALLTFNVQSYWLESYWGGFVAAIGGNLVLGSLLYSFRGERSGNRWWFVPGAVILALTRPFEGLAFVLATLTILGGWQWFANRRQVPKSVRLWIPAVVLSVIVVAVSVGAYNWMTLGSPLHLPYAEYEKQYGLVPVFWPLPLRNEIQFDDPTIERFYRETSVGDYRRTHAPGALMLFPIQFLRIGIVGVLSLFGMSSSAIAAAFFCRRNATIRVLGAVLFVTSVFISFEVWILPHYFAPLIGLVIALGVSSLRDMHAQVKGAGRAPHLVWFTIALTMLSPVYQCVRFVTQVRHEGVARGAPFEIQYKDHPRDVIRKTLENMGGDHVVFIRYSSSHNVHDEWAYNSPDIDSQRVIWARDRGEENWKLEAYYPGRTFWLLEPDTPLAQPQLIQAPLAP